MYATVIWSNIIGLGREGSGKSAYSSYSIGVYALIYNFLTLWLPEHMPRVSPFAVRLKRDLVARKIQLA